MKKIAIITLHSVKNYGSVLQAYATQCYFENMGFDPVIIDYRRPWETGMGYWFYLSQTSLMGVARNIMYFPSKIIQYFRFNKFIKSNLKLTKRKYKSLKDIQKYPIDASIYCTGSDQVWNSGWNKGIIPEYYLNFVDNNSLKISFAASFGNSNIIEEDRELIKALLERYKLITVREKASVDMLEKNLGLKSYEFLDPTLQMSDIFWKSICKLERKISEKYILLIQLNRNHEFDELAVNFSKLKGLKLIRLCLRVDQMLLPGKSIVIPKVEDYLRLIRDAEYVLTDSFHAVSFCLNFEKQFYIYFPEKYSERLQSILSILGLVDRNLKTFNYSACIDYTKVNDSLKKKRTIAKQIIMEAIENE